MNRDRTHLLRLRTPEGVAFSFRLASPVLRLVAQLIDTAVVSAAWTIVSLVFGLLELISADLARGLGIVGYFVLAQGYRMWTEWMWRGQTIGKRALRLRVIDRNGLPLTFPQIMLRNLLRFIDALPFAYAVGGIATVFTKNSQRLGDLAAGTVVIWEPVEVPPDLEAIRSDKYNSLRAHPAVVARLRQAVRPEAARAAWQALARRDTLEPVARIELFAEIAAHLRALTTLPTELTEGVSDEQFVRNVVDVLFLTRS